jgi:hypothetical protein
VATASGASVIVDDNGNIAINSAGGASLSLEKDKVQLGEPRGTGFVLETGKMSVNARQFVVNTEAFSVGTVAGYPVLLLTPSALAWILGHTHESTTPGSPTSPPIPMPTGDFPADSFSKRMQTS